MGLLKWLGLQRVPKETPKALAEIPAEDPIAGFELYAAEPKGRWVKLMDLEAEVDFQEVEDARPGYTYKLASRTESGKIRTIWHQAVPGGISGAKENPVQDMIDALGPFKTFGDQISTLKESIQGAFGWALPQQPEGGGVGSTLTYKGDLPVWLHPEVPKAMMSWTPFIKEMTKDITEGVREGLLGIKPKDKTKESPPASFSKPAPSADEFLEQDGEKPEAS